MKSIVGHFVWDVKTGTVWADQKVAEIFGFSEQECREGFGLARFLGSLHIDDVGRVATATKLLINDGGQFDLFYRVIKGNETTHVRSLGRCFGSPDGPMIASGSVTAVTAKARAAALT